MTVNDDLRAYMLIAAKMVKDNKDQLVAKAWQQEQNDGSDTVDPMVIGIRDGEPVVIIVAHGSPTREDALRPAAFAAIYFSCDIVVFTTEGWRSATKDAINPETGVMWAAGELEHAALNGGVEKGWVGEGLTHTAVDRHGHCVTGVTEFKVDRTGPVWNVKWEETQFADEDFGYMSMKLKDFMKMDDLWSLTQRDPKTKAAMDLLTVNLSLLEQKTQMDVASVKKLQDEPVLIGLIGSDMRRKKIIDDELGDMVISDEEMKEAQDSKD